MSEIPKQHTAQILHSEPVCSPVQEVSQVPEEMTESPTTPPQTLYKLQEGQPETNVENIKKEQIEKSVEESTTQLPDKTVVQTSKLNPNAKEFVFNPNTKPFIPVSKILINKQFIICSHTSKLVKICVIYQILLRLEILCYIKKP